ncbi:MAG TPA: CRTAC1 family protein [Gemmataceae bacterium]|nr:CRTAC1 family protein [Gemmataceae bacterium]
MRRCSAVVLVAGLAASTHAAEPFPVAFEDVTAKAGLLEPLAGLMGHGAAWGDFDGDGRPDLFVGGFCDRPDAEYAPAKGPVASGLFHQRPDGTFEHVKDSPANVFARTSGALFIDLDNDGRPELYVANNARAKGKKGAEPQTGASVRRSMLLRNEGGKLADISATSTACPESLLSARNVIPLDYNADGRLDLLLIEDRFTPSPQTRLFRNDGGLKFTDVTTEVGLPAGLFGLGAAVADLNGDGRPDIFVPHSNRLFLSTPGNKYREATELQGVFAWKPLDNEDWPCGACFADLNGDGRPDLVLTIHGKTARNKVYINDGLMDGVPRFRDVMKEVGLGDPVPVKCPHVEVQDFDNDGRPDIYISAAWLDDGQITPLIFHNTGVKDGLPRFVPPRPIGGPMVYFPAGPSADYDGDGRVDLFLVNWFANNHSRLLRNVSPPRNWLDVRARGNATNRDGIGATVTIYRAGGLGKPDARLGVIEINVGYGYASGQLPVAHFGLADAAAVDVRVTWPNGKTADRPNTKANQVLVVEEP